MQAETLIEVQRRLCLIEQHETPVNETVKLLCDALLILQQRGGRSIEVENIIEAALDALHTQVWGIE